MSISTVRNALPLYRRDTGQPLLLWGFIALLQLATQIVLRRELMLGQFGMLNTALGVIGLLMVPILALAQALPWYLARTHAADQSARLDALRGAAFLVLETVIWLWAGVSLLILFVILPRLSISNSGVQVCILLNVFASLGILISGAICQQSGHGKGWNAMLAVSFVLRLLLAAVLAHWQPLVGAVLGAFILASIVPLIPVLRHIPASGANRLQALRTLFDRDFLLYLGATISVFLSVFLFINADRLVAQCWFGTPSNNNLGLVNWAAFDSYQTTGLIARALLWGTQPLLFIWFAHRSPLDRTTTASMLFFWIYLAALILGFLVLLFLPGPLSQLFSGAAYEETAGLLPTFALAALPLGLLQAIAFFSLASRRFPECFVLGACGIGYTFLLYFVGREAELMPAYMFGGGMVALMIVLFVGVARWGRKQP